MENNTIHFLDFVKKINDSTNVILSKTNYADTINNSIPNVESKIARKRKILSEFSKEEESDLRYLSDIFVKINLCAGD